jgi:acetyl-CoA carboxylase biotin carboxyl carrier protein
VTHENNNLDSSGLIGHDIDRRRCGLTFYHVDGVRTVQLDFEQLRDLLTAIHQTDINELKLKGENFELQVRRGAVPEIVTRSVEVVNSAPSLPAAPAAPEVAPVAATPPSSPKTVDVKSPIVGTLYRAAGPDEAPFISVGERVKVGQTVCIIEAMKIMNEIEAEVSGEVVEILVQNGQPVEFDQPLLRVIPD